MRKAIQLALLLCASFWILMTAFPLQSYASATGQCGDSVYYELKDNGTVRIYGSGIMWDYPFNPENPEQLSPFRKTNIPINEIVIENGVTNVGACSFTDCSTVTQISLPEGADYGPDKLHDPGEERCHRSTSCPKGGKAEKAEDQDRIADDVDDNRRARDQGTGARMLRDLHHRQVHLGDAGQKIGPAGNPKIGAADGGKNLIICEKLHQNPRGEDAGKAKEKVHDNGKPKHHVEDVVKRLFVLNAPVLGTQNRPC